jgi:lysozyme family protein
MSFERAIANVLKNEGGLVENPSDPGGLTNFGISQRAYPNLDIRNLTIGQATQIYRTDYWGKIRGDELWEPLAFVLLDFAANSGVSEATKALQRALKVPVDGVMGPQTTSAAAGRSGIMTSVSVERIFFLTGLPAWRTFGRGWATRVINTAVEAFEP